MDGTRVQRLRRERGFTQERLAEASGITVRTVQRIEAGNSATLETQALIARTLGVELGDLRTPEEAAAAETAPVEAAAVRASVAEAPPTRPARTPDPAPVAATPTTRPGSRSAATPCATAPGPSTRASA
jgi:transcriptional regulator with XRE-family HTH domain